MPKSHDFTYTLLNLNISLQVNGLKVVILCEICLQINRNNAHTKRTLDKFE